MKIVKNVRPPAGLSRLLYRLPIYVYRAGLGWVFGNRIMLLHHIGRRSGNRRYAVLEVVEHDPADGSFVVASGWGPTAAWYQNVVHKPDVTVQVGRRTMPVRSVTLDADEGAEIFARYAVRHRMAAKFLLPRLMGFSVDGSEADFREAGRHMPFVRFVPGS
ncbi:nitroreductase family deazaflavin-dependent oxidoreductase [Mycobacterium kansasii]|uniref:Deazaflavin-dependent oxidoreductase, nitroreductase family protein n=1 Tax=Mycobacterium kansasii 662 TaxID=1299326 RepID=X7ZHM2_MYCKA|nr:nitroreductase family deazaflavin-dependent oxidoreductase [Mycobacterium kansasii]ARG59853.1 nitroreductase [Mycobacterium kansasii]ARG65316.1 nitroreductase [Mycobacterium kansasii]ARG73069.1 nitroreductase [Mycobacterium kansasii]ARG77926.1 nitroreductase [Mycobacterium kansasii]ARG83378.1 nitroreductase [Mycobacterium kansasii]